MTRQQVHLLHRLKQADRLREYTMQELSGPGKQKLLSALEEAKKEAMVAQEKAEEGARLLQEKKFNIDTLKSKLSHLSFERDNLKDDANRMQVEYDQLALNKVEADREIARLRYALEESQKALKEAQERAETEKKALQEDFQQQADEAFYFGYRCCMWKNNLLDDVPTVLSDMEEKEEEEPATAEIGKVASQVVGLVVVTPENEAVEEVRPVEHEVVTPALVEEEVLSRGENGAEAEQIIDIVDV